MNTRKKKRGGAKGLAMLAILLLISLGVMLIWRIRLWGQGEKWALDFTPSTSNAASDEPSSDATETIAAFAQEHNLTFDATETIAAFAQEHNLTLSDWPDSLLELLEKNPEAADFVLNYPLKKDLCPEIDLHEYTDCSEVPLFLQWDERWGYTVYGDNIMGLSGCGPTCLSMVCVYLLNDPQYSPRYIADFAQENGYCVPGNGSSWTLISEGGVMLGLDVIEIPLDEDRIIRNLEVGNPVVCIMGPGDFTSTGHFIVMTGYEDGKIKVNDPNSPDRSNMLWDYDAIKDQIRNLWVCR